MEVFGFYLKGHVLRLDLMAKRMYCFVRMAVLRACTRALPARIYVLMEHEFGYECGCVGIVKTSLVNLDFVMRSVMESLHGIDARS